MYVINPRNANFDDLPFDNYERLINRWQLYCINYNIIFGLINGSSVYVKTNQMWEKQKFSLVYWSIDNINSAWDHRNIKGFNYVT